MAGRHDQAARRRGKRIAVVALARRLTGLLWAMWRDQAVYDPQHRARHATRTGQTTDFQAQALERAAKKQQCRKRRAQRAVANSA